MDHSVETTLGRRSFLALLSAAAATGALPAPARGATSRAATGTTTGTARITPATIAAAEQIAGMSYTNAERAVLAETPNSDPGKIDALRGHMIFGLLLLGEEHEAVIIELVLKTVAHAFAAKAK